MVSSKVVCHGPVGAAVLEICCAGYMVSRQWIEQIYGMVSISFPVLGLV